MANKVRKGAKTTRRLKYEAAIAAGKTNAEAGRIAGYSPNTVKNKGAGMAAEIRASMAEAYRRAGLTEERSAQKLAKLLDAETVKWNPKKSRWDAFGDGDLQLRAVQEINRVLDGYPAPKEPTEDSRPITIVFGKSLSSMMPPAAKASA